MLELAADFGSSMTGIRKIGRRGYLQAADARTFAFLEGARVPLRQRISAWNIVQAAAKARGEYPAMSRAETRSIRAQNRRAARRHARELYAKSVKPQRGSRFPMRDPNKQPKDIPT